MTKDYSLAREVTYFLNPKTNLVEEACFGIVSFAHLTVCERSGLWYKVRNEVVSKNPFCTICNSSGNLHVHHIKPYHLYPELELTESNLVVLCLQHHFDFGHFRDWKAYNPTLLADLKKFKEKIYGRIPNDSKRN